MATPYRSLLEDAMTGVINGKDSPESTQRDLLMQLALARLKAAQVPTGAPQMDPNTMSPQAMPVSPLDMQRQTMAGQMVQNGTQRLFPPPGAVLSPGQIPPDGQMSPPGQPSPAPSPQLPANYLDILRQRLAEMAAKNLGPGAGNPMAPLTPLPPVPAGQPTYSPADVNAMRGY